MSKQIILIIATSLALSNVFAQVNNDDAKNIMNNFSKKMKTYNTMKFKFVYRMLDEKHDIDDSKEGTIYIEGDKYRLYIADQVIISDGESSWTHIKEANEVQINEVDPLDENTPNKMLTSYDKNYKPKYIRDEKINGKLCYILDLTPKEAKTFFKVRLYIAKDDYAIQSSIIYDKNGTTYSYKVVEFLPNVKINESRFTFNFEKYPDVTVIDMR